MRVSTAMMFQGSVNGMLRAEAELLHTQQRLASGKRMLGPGDDPVAASRAVELRDRQAAGARYAANISAAVGELSFAEAKLGEAGGILQAARELLVAAGNGAYSDGERAALALDLRARRDQLLAVANSTDAQGRYLFAGYQDSQPPFSATGSGVAYTGDQGRRALAIAPARELEVSASGDAVFQQGRTGNGTFALAAAPANTGSGSATTGKVYDAALLTGDDYRVLFGAGGATYDVVDLTTGATVVSGAAWASGQALRFEGIEFTIEGAPDAGDRYDITPSTKQSVFAALDAAVALLSTPQPSAASRAAYSTGLGRVLAEMDASLGSLLERRAAFGASLREAESALAANEAEQVGFAARLSATEDLDYAQAASDLARHKLALEAAQQAHVLTTRLSLFEKI